MMKSILPNSRRADISFHPSGRIDISAHVARKLSLSPGDVIDITQENDEWYLYVKLRVGNYTGRHNGHVWTTANGKGTFRTWSKSMTDAVFAATGIHSVSALRFPCGAEIRHLDITYITIIHRLPL